MRSFYTALVLLYQSVANKNGISEKFHTFVYNLVSGQLKDDSTDNIMKKFKSKKNETNPNNINRSFLDSISLC